jgi:hypothetical protein
MSARLVDRLFVALLSLIVIVSGACSNQNSQTPNGVRSLIVDALFDYDDLDPARGTGHLTVLVDKNVYDNRRANRGRNARRASRSDCA